ncbi:hypothetical protein FRB94_009495 [Tulasnella sp. JGI-2019a]|nr:hypothetical protein FRB94_009495 [Tulasnella sp. JGI-2019a]
MLMQTKLERRLEYVDCHSSWQRAKLTIPFGLALDQFYFAVQSGGTFEIDFEVTSPVGKVVLAGQKEKQGDYIFTANQPGEYSFCFENDMTTLTEKLVDFDIMVESEPRREAPAKQGQIAEKTSALEESIYKLKNQLTGIQRTQKYFHTRESRGMSIVKETASRMFWYGVLESAAIIGMAVFQVYIVQMFFTSTGRRYKV